MDSLARSIIKSTAIDPSVVDADGVYRKTGPVRVFTSERAAIAAVKGLSENPIKADDVIALIGCGPMGTGMEETYQLTSALKYLPYGKTVALITDARFSGVSTGACIGHIGPEALAGGPLGKLRDGDMLQIIIDRVNLSGTIDLIGEDAHTLDLRPPHPHLKPNPDLPEDTRLWAALQNISGGTWVDACMMWRRSSKNLEVCNVTHKAQNTERVALGSGWFLSAPESQLEHSA